MGRRNGSIRSYDMDEILEPNDNEFFDDELTFRRYFSTHPNPVFRKAFTARLEVLDFGDSVLNAAIEKLRVEINRRYRANLTKIKPADDMRAIHLDYVASRETNALAFYVDDLACVAVSDPAIRKIVDISTNMAISPMVRSILGVAEGQTEIVNQAGAFFTMNMQVLICHELGHIFHGHCFETARSIPRAEASNADELCFTNNIETTMRRQAMEVDADGYVPKMMLQNLFSSNGSALAEHLQTELPEPEFIMTFLLLSLGSVFYTLGPRRFHPDRVEHCDHPPALMRMNVFMADIEGWCSENQPTLLNWGTLERFQTIMETVASTADAESTRAIWDEQGRFLTSPDGIAYKDRLYAKREVVRNEMLPHQWHVITPGEEGL